MDFKVVTFLIMFLFSFTIFGCKAHQGAAGDAPSWMSSFQRGPESGGTLYGLLNAPPTNPSGPDPSTLPHPAEPDPSTLPHPSDPHPPVLPQPSGDPAAPQPPSLPRPLGPPEPLSLLSDIHDCDKAFCTPKVHHPAPSGKS